MKRLASYPTEQQAALIEAKLKDTGIQCFLTNKNTMYVPHAPKEIDLMVAEEDFDMAAQIVGISNSKSELICPKCNSTNTEPKFAKSPALMVFIILFAFIPLPIFREKNICKDCGTKF